MTLLVPLLGLIGGCSQEPSPLSPLAVADPIRFAKAGQEMEETARRSREAELQFYRRRAARPVLETSNEPTETSRNP